MYENVTDALLTVAHVTGGGGGGSATLVEKTVVANGVYNASGDSADGYSKVTVEIEDAPTLITKTITSNETYTALRDGADGYKSVTVAVPNTYAASDEGKVVSNGALVPQTSGTVTANDTYDTTLINSLTVNVSGGGGGWQLLDSGTYTNASSASSLTIPIPYSTGRTLVYVENVTPPSSTAQTLKWARMYIAALPTNCNMGRFTSTEGVKAAGDKVYSFGYDSTGNPAINPGDTEIVLHRISSTYPILAGTYNWYIWGV